MRYQSLKEMYHDKITLNSNIYTYANMIRKKLNDSRRAYCLRYISVYDSPDVFAEELNYKRNKSRLKRKFNSFRPFALSTSKQEIGTEIIYHR